MPISKAFWKLLGSALLVEEAHLAVLVKSLDVESLPHVLILQGRVSSFHVLSLLRGSPREGPLDFLLLRATRECRAVKR